MARLSLNKLRAGMTLKEPAVGPGGRQLAPAGIPLGENHLQILRAWGIDAVEVVEEDTTCATANVGAAAVASVATVTAHMATQAAQRVVAPRFRGQPVFHSAIRTLFAIAVARELRRASRGAR